MILRACVCVPRTCSTICSSSDKSVFEVGTSPDTEGTLPVRWNTNTNPCYTYSQKSWVLFLHSFLSADKSTWCDVSPTVLTSLIQYLWIGFSSLNAKCCLTKTQHLRVKPLNWFAAQIMTKSRCSSLYYYKKTPTNRYCWNVSRLNGKNTAALKEISASKTPTDFPSCEASSKLLLVSWLWPWCCTTQWCTPSRRGVHRGWRSSVFSPPDTEYSGRLWDSSCRCAEDCRHKEFTSAAYASINDGGKVQNAK